MGNRLWLLVVIALGLAACGETRDFEGEPGAPAPDVAARADDADDTGLNTRDRDEDTKTPLDQSNAERDLELTRQIRQQIMDGGFSTDAENVKVITEQGRVTLRGPVENEEEKLAIVAIARGVAGGAEVDDQLEVARD
jgi:hypothetical protein